MAEETVLEQEQTKTDTADVSSMLQRAAFGDNEPSQQNNADDVKTDDNAGTKKSEEVKTNSDNTTVPVEWLKKEFEVEDPAILKAEREELKSAKEKLKNFDLNEDSLKVYDYLKDGKEDDLYNYLSTKKRIEKLTSNEVTESNAAEIVKFQMQQKYNTLSEDDINYKFNRQYGLPKEPQEDKYLTTEEYNEAKEEWDQKVVDIKKELLLDAKLAVPDIQKLKTELTLPNIVRENKTDNQPSPEELAAFNTAKDSFLQTVQNVNFNGFTAQVKNKDVDYNVAYTPSQEEKTVINQRMQSFAESGFDANSLFTDRWVNNDMTLNVQQMTEDLSRIFMGKNADAKIANEAANKRLELYLQDKKQIDINQTNEEGKLTLDKGNQSIEDVLREKMLSL